MEQFLISIDELERNVKDDDVQRIVELMLFYFTQSNKEFTEKYLMNKLKELDGKGEEIVSILQERENKGILKGREEAREESREAMDRIALNMLKDGLSIEHVAKYFEFSVEKVEELRRKI